MVSSLYTRCVIHPILLITGPCQPQLCHACARNAHWPWCYMNPVCQSVLYSTMLCSRPIKLHADVVYEMCTYCCLAREPTSLASVLCVLRYAVFRCCWQGVWLGSSPMQALPQKHDY